MRRGISHQQLRVRNHSLSAHCRDAGKKRPGACPGIFSSLTRLPEPIGENLFGSDHRVNGSGKSGKDRDRQNDFHNFGLGAADIQCAIDMHDQLGLACAERCKRRNGGELAALYVERGTRIDMAEHNSIK